MWSRAWAFLRDEANLAILSKIGAGLAARYRCSLGGLRLFLSAEERRWRRCDQGRSQLRQRRRPRHFCWLFDHRRRRVIFGKLPAEIRKDLAVRAITPLAFLFAIGIFAPAARSETQVKAEDCSEARITRRGIRGDLSTRLEFRCYGRNRASANIMRHSGAF